MFLQQLVNGLTLGSVYALIALGYTMVYGILELINFAHGEIYMLGAYLSIILLGFFTAIGLTSYSLYLSLALTLLITVIFCASYGFTVEKIAYKPLRNAPRLSPLISAIGVSIFLQNYVMLTQGATDKVFPSLFGGAGFTFLSTRITYVQASIILVSACMMMMLHTFIRKTKTGKAMRAVAQDKVMASLLGDQHRYDHFSDIHYRFRACRCCRIDGRHVLRSRKLFHRLLSRHQGLYSSGPRRHRQHTRGNARRHTAGAHREPGSKLHIE